MARKKKKRKSVLRLVRESWFYRIYFAALGVCAVALAIGLIVLSGVMREYEQTRPVHCAEETLALFERRDWAEIYAMDLSARKLKWETQEQYAQYLTELSAGKEFSLKNVLSIDENQQQYNVMMDGQKFAEILLEHSGETTRHHFEGWRTRSVETLAFAAAEYTITAPADAAVQVNGVALSAEDAIETGIETEASGNLPEGVAAPTMTRYGVYISFGESDALSISATDGNGKALEVVQTDEHSWSCGLSYDEDVRAKIEESVVKWGRRLAAYTTGDYSKSDLSGACVNPSPARTYIRNMENQWAATHSGYDFENIRTYDCYVYSDDCISCKISFDYIVHYRQEDKTYPTQYTLYFARDNGSFKLYSFTMD